MDDFPTGWLQLTQSSCQPLLESEWSCFFIPLKLKSPVFKLFKKPCIWITVQFTKLYNWGVPLQDDSDDDDDSDDMTVIIDFKMILMKPRCTSARGIQTRRRSLSRFLSLSLCNMIAMDHFYFLVISAIFILSIQTVLRRGWRCPSPTQSWPTWPMSWAPVSTSVLHCIL